MIPGCDVCSRDPRLEGPPHLELVLGPPPARGQRQRALHPRIVCAGCVREDRLGGPLGPHWRMQLSGYYAREFSLAMEDLQRITDRMVALETAPPVPVHASALRPSRRGFALCGARVPFGGPKTTLAGFVTCARCCALLAGDHAAAAGGSP